VPERPEPCARHAGEVVEQPDPVAEQHRDEGEIGAARDRDVLAASSGARPLERCFDAGGHERVGGAALLGDRVAGAVGDHEHGHAEGRVVSPGPLAGVEHRAPHIGSRCQFSFPLRDGLGAG
jgi:hypothetical protein